MNRQFCGCCLLVLSALTLASCSGVSGGGCIVNCSSGGSVSIVLIANPPATTSALSIQAFTLTITGLTLTPSDGSSSVAVNLNSASYIAEFNRVTSDSTLLASRVAVPSGNYNQLKLTFSAPKVTFCTQSNPGVQGCAIGTLASVVGSPGSFTTPANLTVADNQLSGIVLNANLGNALTLSGQTITGVDLTLANTFTATALPFGATDLASGQLSHLDDIMGLVTGATSSSVTIQTSTRGSITATTNSSTQYNCPAQNPSCVQTNQVAVIDAILNADGTIVAVFFQPMIASGDLIEGVVSSVPDTVTNQFTVVATDSVFAPSNSVLNGQLNLGDQVLVTLAGTVQPFVIIDKGMGLTIPSNGFDGGTSISEIQPGMTVAFPVTAYTPQSGSTPGGASTATFALRFTRLTAAMATAALPDFSVTGTAIPPFFGIATNPQFRTTTGRLSVDGAAILTAIPAGNTISSSALYLGTSSNPAFVAQSVRAH
jgi:hypothetical protein